MTKTIPHTIALFTAGAASLVTSLLFILATDLLEHTFGNFSIEACSAAACSVVFAIIGGMYLVETGR